MTDAALATADRPEADLVLNEAKVVTFVSGKIKTLVESGDLELPPNYSVANAMKSVPGL